MKLNRTESKWLFTLILAFHITSVQVEASHDDDDVRILIVGIRGDSRFSAADILSGRTDGGQEDREIVKTPVITDEGRRMMLVTGPNLCEEDTARQSFTTALFLSSPGPHAVLMVLNLEDEESEQCDVVKRAQELLGAEVLQYCIVLLHQERFTGASRGIAGEMSDACGGRFHMIRDSEPDQTAALVAEIDKLVWLNGDGFYSVLRQELKTEETSEDVHEEIQLFLLKYDNSVKIVGWILLILLNAALLFSEGRHEHFYFGEILVALVSFTVTLRNILNPNVAVPLNLIVSSTFAIAVTYYDLSNSRRGHQIIMFFIMIFAFPSIVFISGLGLTLGTVMSVRSWSDVLIACHAATGVTFGAHLCTVYSITPDQMQIRTTLMFALKLFLFCLVGVTLSVGFASVFTLFLVKMTIILGFTIAYSHLKRDFVRFVIFFLIFPCCCVFIGSFISFLCSVLFQYIFTVIWSR
ncbi:uncharacterized protein LOC125246860 [Megalobrama amblycephala]|uniref:uncharacterized protein LOC125246860 n=1 Tax=Megalobrama amblycephala TaxID=75352 RepID=UPI002013C5F0|nr:uncharacterized protein LOC125246860 [Megalobrama amblycephala]